MLVFAAWLLGGLARLRGLLPATLAAVTGGTVAMASADLGVGAMRGRRDRSRRPARGPGRRGPGGRGGGGARAAGHPRGGGRPAGRDRRGTDRRAPGPDRERRRVRRRHRHDELRGRTGHGAHDRGGRPRGRGPLGDAAVPRPGLEAHRPRAAGDAPTPARLDRRAADRGGVRGRRPADRAARAAPGRRAGGSRGPGGGDPGRGRAGRLAPRRHPARDGVPRGRRLRAAPVRDRRDGPGRLGPRASVGRRTGRVEDRAGGVGDRGRGPVRDPQRPRAARVGAALAPAGRGAGDHGARDVRVARLGGVRGARLAGGAGRRRAVERPAAAGRVPDPADLPSPPRRGRGPCDQPRGPDRAGADGSPPPPGRVAARGAGGARCRGRGPRRLRPSPAP